MTRVLLTGGSGFIAAHIIDVLLKRGHSVVTTVRSREKAQNIQIAHQGVPQDKLDFIVIPDMAAEGAFRGLGAYNLEALIHVASPFHYNVTDPKKDLIDPAVLGTTGVLKAIKEFCPTVRRVVLTSSFAAILNPSLASSGAEKTYSEADWSPLTIDDAYTNALNAYVVSKTMAEKAAWDFVAKESPNFSLSAINPPMVYGPVRHNIKSLSSINTSNQLLTDLICGKYKSGLPPTGLPLWVDVRDVALAHVKAMELEEAADKRFFLTAGYYSNADMWKIVYENFPDLRSKLPDQESRGGEPNKNLASFGYDTSRSTAILGLKWTPFETSVVDTVKSLLAIEA